MLVQKEVSTKELATAIEAISEKELFIALGPFIKKSKLKTLKTGQRRPFKPFDAIKMKGNGPIASEMVVNDRV